MSPNLATVFTNGRVALATDLIFGVIVLSEDGWLPFASLDAFDKEIVRRLLDWNPTCPEAIRTVIYAV
jgi:hypothetical protein